MRKIMLNNLSMPDKSSVYTAQKMYRIFLGNGVQLLFSDHKKAVRALVSISRQLTIYLYQISDLIGVLYVEYRRAWFYLDKDPKTVATLDYHFSVLHDCLTKMTKNSGVNFNHYVFTDFHQAICALTDIINLLRPVLIKRKDFLTISKLRVLTSQIETIRKSIDAVGKDLCVNV